MDGESVLIYRSSFRQRAWTKVVAAVIGMWRKQLVIKLHRKKRTSGGSRMVRDGVSVRITRLDP